MVAQTANSKSYRNLRHSGKGGPLRSFFYNVTYEALVFATQQWHAKRISFSHLSPSGSFHRDIATCHAEALAHFCDDEPLHAPSSFVFCGCCINPKPADTRKTPKADDPPPGSAAIPSTHLQPTHHCPHTESASRGIALRRQTLRLSDRHCSKRSTRCSTH